MSSKVITCDDCKAGAVVPVAKDGRFLQFKGVYINLPASFVLPRCNHCNADWVSPEDRKRLDKVLAEEYAEHEEVIQLIVTDYRASQ